jgi:hypothetical protein
MKEPNTAVVGWGKRGKDDRKKCIGPVAFGIVHFVTD